MRLIDFRDTCIIQRGGAEDEWENKLNPDTIYEGACLYEEGGTGYSRSIITRAPTVFLPENDVLVMINDSVTITTEKGREIKAIAKIIRDVNLPWRAGIKCTRIELKQAQGD